MHTTTSLPAPVADLNDLRHRRQTAMAKHPSSQLAADRVPAETRTMLLLIVARTWDALVDLFATAQAADRAEQSVLALAAALVHPDARPSLGAFGMPELRRLTDQLEAIERGDISHKDLEHCGSYDEAVADAQADIDFEMWQLLTGTPTRLACRGCRNRLPVHAWRVQNDCPDHVEGRLS